MTYKGIWGKLQKWNERSSTCRCLCNKLGCEEMHVQHGQEASIVSGTTSPDHKWDDRSQNSTGQERCRVSVYFALLSYTKLSKKFSKAIFFQLGQENWLREFFGLIQSDPILSVFPDTSLRCGVRRHSGLGHQGRCHLRQCFLARKDWLVWLEGCWPTKICFFFSMFQQATTKHGANIFRFTRENIGGI